MRGASRPLRVACVIGTRPEAIKLAPVVWALEPRAEEFELSVVATAQHRSLLDQAFAELGIRAAFDLDLMREDQALGDYASRSLAALGELFGETAPDVVVVQGDTTTVMTAALAGVYAGAEIAHVEAGLRSFDRSQPFPEELNRRMAGVLSTLHFAPTERARANLEREGIDPRTIWVTGNTIVDAIRAIDPGVGFDEPALETIDFEARRVILVTAHRRENHGPNLTEICQALVDVINAFPDAEILFPVHPNPHVRSVVEAALGRVERIHLLRPLGYLDLLRVLHRCWLVVTDSGGLQEEAPTIGKPVLILRDVTERPEVVEAGAGVLVGARPAAVLAEVHALAEDEERYQRMAAHRDLFGDGRAAGRIADVLAPLPRR